MIWQHRCQALCERCTGQATLMDPTPEEVRQACQRIEAKRSRDRKWAKKTNGHIAIYDGPVVNVDDKK